MIRPKLQIEPNDFFLINNFVFFRGNLVSFFKGNQEMLSSAFAPIVNQEAIDRVKIDLNNKKAEDNTQNHKKVLPLPRLDRSPAEKLTIPLAPAVPLSLSISISSK
jgi:hypothetical protein